MQHEVIQNVLFEEKRPLSEYPQLAIYTDFRQYLKDFFDFKKQETRDQLRPYSYAVFSAAADIKSPQYLKLVIEGQRNLSDQMIKKFARALQLSKIDEEEFGLLVHYSQSSDPRARNEHLQRLSHFRSRKQIKSGAIDEKTWDKIDGWLPAVLFAMADQRGVVFHENHLYPLLKKRVSKEQIRRAIKRLVDDGDLIWDDLNNNYKRARPLLSGIEKMSREQVKKLQSELVYLGLESLYDEEIQDREFGFVTATLTKEEFEKIKFELRQWRKKVLKETLMAREAQKGDQVYQLNIQFFPVSDKA
jgi:uncharacterized protein (TIGR02147 family)